MKCFKLAILASVLFVPVFAQSQPYLFPNTIAVTDSRIFNVSSDGSPYVLDDNPYAVASFHLVQGPRGQLSGSMTVSDNNGHVWGPAPVAGKLSVKGFRPLTLKLKGADKAFGKIQIAGDYDAGVQLFRLRVDFRSPSKIRYSWNDSFTPDYASATGYSLHLNDVSLAPKNTVLCNYTFVDPASAAVLPNCKFSVLTNNRFRLKTKGSSIEGSWNPTTDMFNVSSCKGSAGYGKIVTPGSLVSIAPITIP